MSKTHYEIPAIDDRFIRVACRSREFQKYTKDLGRVDCARCLKTEVFREAWAKMKKENGGTVGND